MTLPFFKRKQHQARKGNPMRSPYTLIYIQNYCWTPLICSYQTTKPLHYIIVRLFHYCNLLFFPTLPSLMTLPFFKMKRHQARKGNPMQRPGALPLLVVTIQIQNRIESHSQIQVQSQSSNSKPEKSPKSQMRSRNSKSKFKPRIQFNI